MEPITQTDLLLAGLLGDDALTEASLGRVYQHYLQSGKQSWAIISADRSERTPEQNNRKREELKDWLKALGLGYFPLKGRWTEDGKTYAEPSFFIVGIGLEDAKRALLPDTFNQRAILYAGPETEGAAQAFFNDGAVKGAGKFHPRKIGELWSEVKGKAFTFESEIHAGCWSDALALDSYRKHIAAGKITEDELRNLDLKLKSMRW